MGTRHKQVFFVDDKAMPGWSVVVKNEARGRRITCTEMEHCLGQEESSGDRDIFPGVQMQRMQAGEENNVVSSSRTERTGTMRRWPSRT